jgi:diadenosine tetraphosphate (Ap4A) HIT family hydrolase
MPNETIIKFGYPHTLLKEYRHWVVLLRPKQVTLGSLVLALKGDAQSMGEVGAEQFAELATVSAELEETLRRSFAFDKINYLLLMMVDKHVHFHVIPRYAEERQACGTVFLDNAWPKPPVLSQVAELSDAQLDDIKETLIKNWTQASDS